jgi:hypothetical protein
VKLCSYERLTAHLSVSPHFEIRDRKSFQKRIEFNEFIAIGSPRSICVGHNGRSIGLFLRGKQGYGACAPGEVR